MEPMTDLKDQALFRQQGLIDGRWCNGTSGRTIDVIKCVEKAAGLQRIEDEAGIVSIKNAAGGTLSRQQLTLDNLHREFCGAKLGVHPIVGEDCLRYAHGIRSLVLWMVKNPAEWKSKAEKLAQALE